MRTFRFFRLPRKGFVLSLIPVLLVGLWLGTGQRNAAAAAVQSTPRYTYTVVNSWPHDPDAFTQGLYYENGMLYESTGLYGRSSLRLVEMNSGKVLQKFDVPAQYFAEGMTVVGKKIYQLTWQSQKAFMYRTKNFRPKKEFSYTGEGWGLTYDGRNLILSDGTNRLRFLDPETFQVLRTIDVTEDGQPVVRLNELEYIKGEIFANIWLTDTIVRIDPATGKLLGKIDCTGLLPAADRTRQVDVLNGIAYDPDKDRIFVTGKLWPKMYEIQLKRIE